MIWQNIQNIYNVQNIQNIHYGSLIYNNVPSFFFFSSCVRNFSKQMISGIYFWVLGVFCIIYYYFECVYRIRCRFLYIWSYFNDIAQHFSKNVSEVWTILVRNMFLCFLWIWVLNGPPHPTPIPGVNVKDPFRGKKYGGKHF